MKNSFRVFWFIALITLIGLSFNACGNGDESLFFSNDLLGHWNSDNDSSITLFISNDSGDAGGEIPSFWIGGRCFFLQGISGDGKYSCTVDNNDITFKAAVGNDGKLSISEFTHVGSMDLKSINGTYTKRN